MPLKLDDYFEENEDDRRRDGNIDDDGDREQDVKPKELEKPAADDYKRDFITPDSRRRKRFFIKWGIVAAVVVVLLLVVRSMFFAPAASEGVVRGYVVEFEKSGMFFDSYEGLLVIDSPDSTRTVKFSVNDQKIGLKMWKAMQTDSILVLQYERYRRSLPWRGNSRTIVTGLETAVPTSVSTDKPKFRKSAKND